MTKRDVAVWFCRLWSLSILARAAFEAMGAWFGASSGPHISGGPGFVLGNGLWSAGNAAWLSYVLVAVFLWLFAGVIGNELAAEGQTDAPIAAPADLRPLLVRCIGLTLFFSAVIASTGTLIEWGAFYYSMPGSSRFTSIAVSVSRQNGALLSMGMDDYIPAWTAELIKDAAQAILGFLLAFTPRIRLLLRPSTRSPREI